MTLLLREAPRSREPLLPERLLAQLWRRSQGRKLRTTDGRRLSVIYPGRPAPGHGPDFRDALVELDGQQVAGPVEVHRTPAAWAAHGHRTDPAYHDVILHVVGREHPEAQGAERELPTVVLDGGAAEATARRPVTGAPLRTLARLSEPRLRRDLRAAGMERFHQRARAAAETAAQRGVEQTLFARLMDALGYTENRAPFAELADRLPVTLLQSIARVLPMASRERVLTGVLESGAGLARPTADWVELVGTRPMDPAAWRTAGVRPANHPARRMAAAASLVASTLAQGLASSCATAAQNGLRPLIYLLRGQSIERDGPLVGEKRAMEMAVNAVLPVLRALPGNARLADSLYSDFPALSENTITREARSLLGEHATLRLSACEQQGLMHLYRQATRAQPWTH